MNQIIKSKAESVRKRQREKEGETVRQYLWK
jgi:hypothetical protein